MTGATLADCAHAYFRQSEQLETAILVASKADPLAAGAIMVQRLPTAKGTAEDEAEENWRRAVILMSSLTADELLDPEVATDLLLYRLYHQDGVRVTEGRAVTHSCRCSRDKVATTLKSFPKTEIAEMAEDGVLPRWLRGRPNRPPTGSVMLQGALALGLLYVQSLRELVESAAIVLLIFSGLTALAVFWIRFRHKDLPRPSLIGQLAAGSYLLAVVVLVGFGLQASWRLATTVILIVVAATIAWWLAERKKRAALQG